MDQTLIRKKSKKEKRSKKSKKSKIKRDIPSAPETEAGLDAVMDSQLERSSAETTHLESTQRLHVTKEEAGPPLTIPAEEEELPPMNLPEDLDDEEASTGMVNSVPTPVSSTDQTIAAVAAAVLPEEVTNGMISAKEVLQATTLPSTKKKKRSAAGGDYGAAYNNLYKQLCSRMINRIHNYFQRLYKKSKSPKEFKQSLVSIQRWDQREMNKRAKELIVAYPDIEGYFRYAYAAGVLVLSAVVQVDEESEDVEIEVPKFSEFVKKSYVQSARCLYNNVGVLDPSLPDVEKLRLREYLFAAYGKSVQTALQMMVPLSAIAPGPKKEQLENYDDASDESEEASSAEEESSDESDDESSEEEGSESEEDSSSDEEESSEEEDESSSEEEESSSEEEDFEQVELPEKRRKHKKSKKVSFSKKALNTPDEM
jgi:hypothetical protein